MEPKKPEDIVDEKGYIKCPHVRKSYDKICDSPGGLHFERVRSAEAFLTLILRSEVARKFYYGDKPFILWGKT